MTKIFGTDDAGKIKAISVDDSGHVRISGSINADLLNVEDVTVRGSDAAGSPPTVPPVAIAGNDGTNVRAIAVTTGGLVKVEISDVTEGPPLLTEGVADPGDDTVALSVKPMLVGVSDDGDILRSLLGSSDGAVRVNPTGSGSAALSNVAGSATSVTLLASNTARRGAMIHNDSSAVLYLKLGAVAAATSFTVKMSAGDYYELPSPCYTGVIDGIWDSATGSARVTEVT